MVDFALTFEVAFDVDPGDEPGGGDWTDLSDRLIDDSPLTVTYGTGRLGGSSAGSAGLVLWNGDRAVDPTNSAATYNLVPMRHARLIATVDGTPFPLFRGFVEAWPPLWSSFDSTVAVDLVDGFAWLGTQDADVELPEQGSHERIEDLLDLAGWPAGLRDIADGIKTLEPIEQASANLLRSLQDAAEAEDGDLYVAADGKITFRSRHGRFGSTPAVAFGEGGIPFDPVIPPWDPTRLSNIYRMELESGDVYEVIDAASVTAYGPRVLPSRDLALRAAEAEAWGQWGVDRFAEQRLWIDGLTVDASEEATLLEVLPLTIGDLASVAYTPPAGAAVSEDLDIERISHTIGAVEWISEFDLSPHFGEGPWLTLDDATLGLLGANKLAP